MALTYFYAIIQPINIELSIDKKLLILEDRSTHGSVILHFTSPFIILVGTMP